MIELCDVHDSAGKRTGRCVARGTRLEPGEYYLVVQVWIRNAAGQYLIQRRAPHLVSAPDIWATTAGYVQAGEDSLAGALREVHEELGLRLSADTFRRFDRLAGKHLMQDIWLVAVAQSQIATPVLGPEVADWQWASKQDIAGMIDRGMFFAYSYFDRLPG